MVQHFLWLLPIAAVIALVQSALKLEQWQDIRRQALRSFSAMTLGTLGFALAVELVTVWI